MRNCQKSTIFDASKIYNFRMLQILRDFQKHTSRAEILDMIREWGLIRLILRIRRVIKRLRFGKGGGLMLFN